MALYETCHYAEAKGELAASQVQETAEGGRYRAKIEGAIVRQQKQPSWSAAARPTVVLLPRSSTTAH